MDFQFFDIILFAMIAAFLVLRLRGVLGRRDGGKTGHRDPFAARRPDAPKESGNDDNVISLGDQAAPQRDSAWARPQAEDGDDADSVVADGLRQIQRADRDFTPDGFVEGAQHAFGMILDAFAKGDRETLKGLLSTEVHGNFVRAIEDRERSGHTLEDDLVSINSVDIVEAFMEGRVANVTVKFVSEQVTVTRDVEGQIVDGNPNTATEVTDFWTFARDTRARDPNWELVATRSLD